MSDEMAVRGYIKSYRSSADGGVLVTVELSEPETKLFHRFEMEKGVAVVVARMNESPSAS